LRKPFAAFSEISEKGTRDCVVPFDIAHPEIVGPEAVREKSRVRKDPDRRRAGVKHVF